MGLWASCIGWIHVSLHLFILLGLATILEQWDGISCDPTMLEKEFLKES